MVCRLFPPNHLIPTETLHLFLFSRWDIVCLCIHRGAVQNTKHHSFRIHADSVYTAFFFSSCIVTYLIK